MCSVPGHQGEAGALGGNQGRANICGLRGTGMVGKWRPRVLIILAQEGTVKGMIDQKERRA